MSDEIKESKVFPELPADQKGSRINPITGGGGDIERLVEIALDTAQSTDSLAFLEFHNVKISLNPQQKKKFEGGEEFYREFVEEEIDNAIRTYNENLSQRE